MKCMLFKLVLNKKKNSLDNVMFHYHNYDRKYFVQGKRDKYYSESFVVKTEREVEVDNKFSFGLGGEYKYDWGYYQTKTFTSQTRGHLSNFGIFANAGYKINKIKFYRPMLEMMIIKRLVKQNLQN